MLSIVNVAHADDGSDAYQEVNYSLTRLVGDGFVFLNGQYLAPPYYIERTASAVILNGHALDVESFDLLKTYHYDILSDQESHPHQPPRSPEIIALSAFFDDLGVACKREVTVLSAGRKPLFLSGANEGQDLLQILCIPGSQRQGNDQAPDDLISVVDRGTWSQLTAEFQASPDFLDRTRRHLERRIARQASDEKLALANIWSNRVAYPLTTFAMIVVVLAFGHLLSHKPMVEAPGPDGRVSDSTRQIVLRSLLIVGLLSLVDLVWTITASQTGSMRELNPLGSKMIGDTVHLILFKSVVTTTALGLLYILHRTPLAQVASWWSCLALTLLTARWLTFNAMFL